MPILFRAAACICLSKASLSLAANTLGDRPTLPNRAKVPPGSPGSPSSNLAAGDDMCRNSKRHLISPTKDPILQNSVCTEAQWCLMRLTYRLHVVIDCRKYACFLINLEACSRLWKVIFLLTNLLLLLKLNMFSWTVLTCCCGPLVHCHITNAEKLRRQITCRV